MKCKRLHIVFLISFFLNCIYIHAQPLSFTKINSGTKADITQMLTDAQGREVFFLANKLYRLTDSGAVKVGLPKEGSVRCFYPVSANDLWVSFELTSYAASLLHYKNGVMQSIVNPFSNTINHIFPFAKGKFLMSAYLEMMIYDNGRFYALPQPSLRSGFIKYFLTDTSLIWFCDTGQKLYQYSNGLYKEKMPGKAITDFSFRNSGEGLVLANDELYKINGQKIQLVYKNVILKDVLKILWLGDDRLLMAGKNGLIATYANGQLVRHANPFKETLNNIVFTAPDNIWISGERGIILYCGPKKYSHYIETNTGFAAHNLISYSVPLNNEYGVAMADFNGDKKTDIYTVRIYEQNRLYINYIEKRIVKGFYDFNEEILKRNASGVIHEKGEPSYDLKLGVAAADIDNDNDQDIYLCYLTGSNRLLVNKGNGYFRNVSLQKNRACENMKRSNAAAFADVDHDGDLDLFVTSEHSSNRLFENDGTGHFTDITATSGLASSGGGMCTSFADVNNDGLPDLAVSFWYPGNKLYVNESKKGKIHFKDITATTGIAHAAPAKSNAVVFADVNNDGHVDLFIANRGTPNKLYINNGKGNFTDKTEDYFKNESHLTNGAVFGDFDLDGFLDLYLTNVGENILYRNINGQRFEDVTAAYSAEITGYGTGSATGDMDEDGDPDLYVSNYINGNSKLLQNNTESKTFIKMFLHGAISNKDAIGTKVWLYKKSDGANPPSLAGFREMNGGSGYASLSAKEIIFGCEQDAEYFALVKFPCTKDTLKMDRLTAGKIIEVNELTGFKALYFHAKKSIVLFFKNGENHPEFFKVFLVAVLLFLYHLFNRKKAGNFHKIQLLVLVTIFLVFIILNGFFLFQWPSAAYFTPLYVAMALLIISHLFISRFLSKKMAAQEQQNLRAKLSRDLHDDLASTLGSISIYSNTLKNTGHTTDVNLPHKIAGLSHTALQSISDIIWMTSPSNDTLQSLVSKVNGMMYDVFGDNKIQFISNIDLPGEEVLLNEKLRNNIFLILKEALHNILKHAQASKVQFHVTCSDNQCKIFLKDNGIGFNEVRTGSNTSQGNGLRNMQSRAKESGIALRINQEKQLGTEVIIQFNMT